MFLQGNILKVPLNSKLQPPLVHTVLLVPVDRSKTLFFRDHGQKMVQLRLESMSPYFQTSGLSSKIEYLEDANTLKGM